MDDISYDELDDNMKEKLYKQYIHRHLNMNIIYDYRASDQEIKEHCIHSELKYLLKQYKINNCNHSYSSPEYTYGMYGRSVIFCCSLCQDKLKFDLL